MVENKKSILWIGIISIVTAIVSGFFRSLGQDIYVNVKGVDFATTLIVLTVIASVIGAIALVYYIKKKRSVGVGKGWAYLPDD